MSLEPAILAFADGTLFEGYAIGAHGITTGEVVFNTAMTGYQEVITDPSYAGQMVTFTHPHIGNVGVNPADYESQQAWAAGVIVREGSYLASNWRSEQSFPTWLKEQKIIGISGLDTRGLTNYLRRHGSQMATIMSGTIDPTQAIQLAKAAPSMLGQDLTALVSAKTPYNWQEPSHTLVSHEPYPAKYNVVVYDFGVKYSILRRLVDQGCAVTVVPAHTSAEAVLALKPDAIVLSNGPGDPQACFAIIAQIKLLIESQIPLLGICLGHQLLALALGAKTFKMKAGHHGINHPIQETMSGTVQITSQNHNFAVDEHSLPDELLVTHVSLFDGTIQGLRHKALPIMSVQGHPEAGPGPWDAAIIFSQFLALCKV